MDALALLCSLHADGPRSLQRLRQSGTTTLESVTALEVERLADLIAAPPAAAQRFQREAQLLIARLGPGILEPEPPTDVDAPDAALEVLTPAEQAARPAYAAALERWRELDALDAAQAAAETLVEESSAPAPHAPHRTPLEALETLSHEVRTALQAAGVADLEDLAQRDALDVALATGLDYSNAARLRSLARRALPQRGEPRREDRFSVSDVPQAAHPAILPLEVPSYMMRPAPRAGHDARSETVGGPFV